MLDKINNLKLISENDKNILRTVYNTKDCSILKNMSIFSNDGVYKKLDNYNYFETNKDTDIYYINMWFGYMSIFIDSNKKILYDSRFCFLHIEYFINHIDSIINIINNIDLNDNIDIGSDIISIQKWFITYGHFKDEMWSLCDFYNKLNNINNRVLLEYHTDNQVEQYPYNINYKIIENYLFNNSINAYTYKKKLIKIKHLYLIENKFDSKTFHHFPINITKQILSYIDNDIYHERVFITRNKAIHMQRMLDNFNEIEAHLNNQQFVSINPEILSYNEFIRNIRNVDNIVITWGGALTNLIYLKPNTQVTILKSKSYEDDGEKITLFQKIIDTYKLQVKVINHVNNCIDLSTLNFTNFTT
jgi:hypothetical protein